DATVHRLTPNTAIDDTHGQSDESVVVVMVAGIEQAPFHVTVTELASGTTSSGTISNYSKTFTSSFGLALTAESLSVRYYGSLPQGVYQVELTSDIDGLTQDYTIRCIDYYVVRSDAPHGNSTVTYMVGNDAVLSRNVPYGTSVVTPSAGVLTGTDNLAWWTCDLYNTGEAIYYLPGTTVSVTSDMVFRSVMRDPGQGVIAYDFDGGESSVQKIAELYDIGGNHTLPRNVAKAGYRLIGWTFSNDNETVYGPGYVLPIPETDYVLMKAVWGTEGGLTAEFTNGSWNYVMHNISSGTKIAVPCYCDDPGLEGWTDGTDTVGKGESLVLTHDTVFSAVVTLSPDNSVQVTFIPHGGVIAKPVVLVKPGSTVAEPSVSKAGCLFTGWYTLSGQKWDFKTPVESNLLLNARWTEAFSVTYNGTEATVHLASDVGAGNYYILWGDGSVSADSLTHRYAPNTSGVMKITLDSARYGTQTVWFPYEVGDGPVIYSVTLVYQDGRTETVQVQEGYPLPDVSGYSVFTDAGFTESFAGAVHSDLTLYLKKDDSPAQTSWTVYILIIGGVIALVIVARWFL
ncbi:MAG: InlB B-repeat-containing protein, partial [Candidatus Methanomethylophilus sp.]|nr:InlB B-repeat-containing protein [Methanomethylophilus sp.]